jgi:hypothetical protein
VVNACGKVNGIYVFSMNKKNMGHGQMCKNSIVKMQLIHQQQHLCTPHCIARQTYIALTFLYPESVRYPLLSAPFSYVRE